MSPSAKYINRHYKILKPKQMVGGLPAETVQSLQQHDHSQIDHPTGACHIVIKKNPINKRVEEWFGTYTFQKGTQVPQMLQKL